MKYIAALSMLIDHIGMIFNSNEIEWRILGRLAMPIFAYGIACGFLYTSSLRKYTWRLFLFAVISQIPFQLMQWLAYGKTIGFNIGFTFLIALGCLYFLENMRQKISSNKVVVGIGVSGLLFLAQYLGCDYGVYGIAVVISFYLGIKKQNECLGYILFTIITIVYSYIGNSWAQLFALLSMIVISLLKDKRFLEPRFFFYVFYPAHMLIIILIKVITN